MCHLTTERENGILRMSYAVEVGCCTVGRLEMTRTRTNGYYDADSETGVDAAVLTKWEHFVVP